MSGEDGNEKSFFNSLFSRKEKKEPVSHKDRRNFLKRVGWTGVAFAAGTTAVMLGEKADTAYAQVDEQVETVKSPEAESLPMDTIVFSQSGTDMWEEPSDIDAPIGIVNTRGGTSIDYLTAARLGTSRGELTISYLPLTTEQIQQILKQSGIDVSVEPGRDISFAKAELNSMPIGLKTNRLYYYEHFGQHPDADSSYSVAVGPLFEKGKSALGTMYLVETMHTHTFPTDYELIPEVIEILANLYPDRDASTWKPRMDVKRYKLLKADGVDSDQSVVEMVSVNGDDSRSLTIKTYQGDTFELTFGEALPEPSFAEKITAFDKANNNAKDINEADHASEQESYRKTISLPVEVKKNGVPFYTESVNVLAFINGDNGLDYNPYDAIAVAENKALDSLSPVFLQAIRNMTLMSPNRDTFSSGLDDKDLQSYGGG